jgi:hypothetical protein
VKENRQQKKKKKRKKKEKKNPFLLPGADQRPSHPCHMISIRLLLGPSVIQSTPTSGEGREGRKKKEKGKKKKKKRKKKKKPRRHGPLVLGDRLPFVKKLHFNHDGFYTPMHYF